MGTLANIVTIKAKAGQGAELETRLIEIAKRTVEESGCLEYRLHSSNARDGEWMIYERWNAQDDFASHMGQPYMQAIVDDMPRLVEGEVSIDPFTLTDI